MAQPDNSTKKQSDSLYAVLKTATHDTTRALTYVNLAELLYVSYPDTIIPLCKKAIEYTDKNLLSALNAAEKRSFLRTKSGALADMGYAFQENGNILKAIEYFQNSLAINVQIHDKSIEATILNNLGRAYQEQGKMNEAVDCYVRSLNIQEQLKDKKGVATALNNLGLLYKLQGNIAKAIEYYSRALKIYEEMGDKAGMAHPLGNLGTLYLDQGDINKAIEYYSKALKIRQDIGDLRGMANTLNNLGYIYERHEKGALAMEYYNRSMLIKEQIGDKKGLAVTLNNIGHIYLTENNLSEALVVFSKSLKIQEQIDDKDGQASSLEYLGEVYFKLKNNTVAENYTLRSLQLAKELGFPESIKDASNLLYKIYTSEKHYEKALSMHLLFIRMRDSISNEETHKLALKQQLKYEYETKEVLMKAQQEKKDLLVSEESQKQKRIRNTFVAGFLLTTLFAGYIFRNYRQKQQINAELEKKNALVETQNKEIKDSITYAKRIQQAILPPAAHIKKLLPESFVLYKPKDIVAGDFYWMESGEGPIFIAAADCTGHGVPGAMVSVVCSNALNRAVKEFGITEPGLILDKATALVLETFEKSESEVKDGMDISLCCLDIQQGLLSWAGAHTPLRYIQNGELKEIIANKQPVGKHEDRKPFTTHHIQLNKGDLIYLFSDGYADQFGGPEGKKFMSKRLKETFLSIQHLEMYAQKKALEKTFEEWKGTHEQVDDVLVMGIRI